MPFSYLLSATAVKAVVLISPSQIICSVKLQRGLNGQRKKGGGGMQSIALHPRIDCNWGINVNCPQLLPHSFFGSDQRMFSFALI